MNEKERAALVAALLLAADAQDKLYRRDRWKRKLKDALWPLL